MLKTLKFNNQKVFFTSDFHLGHNRDWIFRPRGFASSKEHTEGVLNKINEVVGAEDILINAGDFCLNSSEEDFEYFLSRMNCKNHYLLFGNHNSPTERIYRREVMKKHGLDAEVYPFRYKNIIFVGSYLEMSVNKQPIVVCHYPMDVFNYAKYGAFFLMGHSHNNYEQTRKEYKEGKRLDVGWDGHGKPLSFEEVCEIMKNKTIKINDHHGEEIV